MTTNSAPLLRCLAAGIQAQVPVLLWGNPGIGKTAIIESHARAWGFPIETVIASIRDQSDFLGMPIQSGGSVHYDPPAWARRLAEHDGRSVLYLDEFSTITDAVQKAMLRVVNELVVGELPIPNTSVVAAANPPSSAVDGDDLPAAMANRWMHLDWVSDRDEWLDGLIGGFDSLPVPTLASLLPGGTAADEARVKGLVAGFLRATGGTHVDGDVPSDPSVAGRGWPSRRSWTNAVKVMALLDRDDPANLLALTGLVGEGTAREFVAWRAANDLYDPMEVLADPMKVAWTKERPDRLFALIGAITSMATGDLKVWEPAMLVLATCAKAGRPDLVTPAARKLFRAMPRGAKMPKVVHQQFIDAFTDLMTAEGRADYSGTWATKQAG